MTRIGGEIRRWWFHLHSDKSLQDLAEIYNPVIRGWIGYYSNFYRTQLRPTLKRIDRHVIRWARRKFKRFVHRTKGARDWFRTAAPRRPHTPRPLAAMSLKRPNIGSRVNSRGLCTVLGAPGGESPPGELDKGGIASAFSATSAIRSYYPTTRVQDREKLLWAAPDPEQICSSPVLVGLLRLGTAHSIALGRSRDGALRAPSALAGGVFRSTRRRPARKWIVAIESRAILVNLSMVNRSAPGFISGLNSCKLR